MDIFSVLKLVLGLVFFLFGMNVMSANLEKMAGGKLEHSLKKVTSNPIISILIGIVITIAIQSSSATTVMLVGLVNSGIIGFQQTIFVIFGANIGTTLTVWILSLAGIQSDNIFVQMLKPANFSPIFALIGILLIMISKKNSRKSIGNIFVGFAVLMYGMELMTQAVRPLSELVWFKELLIRFDNPIFGVLVGTVFTAVIQSSAASIGILQALSTTGAITCGMTIPIIMGQNIGTCATALISCIGTNISAKRVAILHFSIKVIGTVLCLSIYCGLDAVFDFAFADITASHITIAIVHTCFNVAITVLLMPFSKLLVKLVTTIVKGGKTTRAKDPDKVFIDDRLLRSPSVAVQECDNYTVKMSALAQKTLLSSITLIKDYKEKVSREVLENEEKLDLYEDDLGTYLVKLSAQALSSQDSQKISKMLHAIGDFERLGDHAVNLLKTAREIHDKNIIFSEEAQHEMNVLTDAIIDIVNLTVEAYEKNDIALASRIEPLEQVIDRLTSTIRNNHILRLQHGGCTIELGFVLSDLLTNYERISDHCSNIAVAIIELVHNSFDTHKYLNFVKTGSSEFNEVYKEFEAQYQL